MKNHVWKSEGRDINADTCIDVYADSNGILLGQVGAAWRHDLKLSFDDALWLSAQLSRATSIIAQQFPGEGA